MTSKYKAAIFDLDGTLLDSMVYWRIQNVLFLSRLGLPVPEEIADHVLDVHSGRAAKIYAEKYDLSMTAQEIIEEYEHVMLGNYTQSIHMKCGLPEFFLRMQNAGIRMCVATMTPSETAKAALQRHDVLKYMEFVTSTYEIGCTKSDAGFFPAVLERLNLQPDECAVFEDAVYAARSAKAAGIDVFGIYDYTARHDEVEMRALSTKYVGGFEEFFTEDGGLRLE